MEGSSSYDVFVSYSHANKELAGRLRRALEGEGMVVWRDEETVEDFASITGSINEGLGASKVLVALYSERYATSRPCQQELQDAFTVALGHAEGLRRILVVNPEAEASHIRPIQLRDALFRKLPFSCDADELRATAKAIANVVSTIDGPLATEAPAKGIPLHGFQLRGYRRFVGRQKELWDVHSGLWASGAKTTSGALGPGAVQVSGMGGVGKSLLAEEYARRFAAAYPGGIFWVKGTLDREDQLGAFAAEATSASKTGVPPKPEELGDILSGLPDYLWIVDDLPPELEEVERRQWFAPSSNGKTLVTTREWGRDGTEQVVQLDALSRDEAIALLTSERSETAAEELAAAGAIVDLLGCHAMAVDLARGLARLYPIAKVLEKIRVRGEGDQFEALVQHLKLPNGHVESIALTLLSSLESLGDSARDVLRLAAVLAPAEIPVPLLDLVFSSDHGPEFPRPELMACFTQSLAVPLEQSGTITALSVHPLVTRVMEFYDSARSGDLRARSKAVLLAMLAPARDVRSCLSFRAYVPHARHIAGPLQSLEDARLLRCVAHYEKVVGKTRAALQDFERVAQELRRLSEPGSFEIQALDLELLNLRANAGDPVSEAARKKRLGNATGQILSLVERLAASGAMAEHFAPLIAEARAGNAIAIRDFYDSLIGPKSRGTAVALINSSTEATWAKRPELARDLLTLALEKYERWHDLDDPNALSARHELAEVLTRLGDLEGARAQLEMSLEGKLRVLPEGHPSLNATRHNLGMALFALGDLDGAREHVAAALKADEQSIEPNPREIERDRAELAQILRAIDERNKEAAPAP